MRGDPLEQDDVLANRSRQHDEVRRAERGEVGGGSIDGPPREASRSTGSRSTATTCVDGQARRAAKAIDPPISPRPTMAILGKTMGVSSRHASTPNAQRPKPNHESPFGSWELAGWEFVTAPTPARATASRQMLRPIAGAMMRSSAIRRSNCDGNIDCAPSLSA